MSEPADIKTPEELLDADFAGFDANDDAFDPDDPQFFDPDLPTQLNTSQYVQADVGEDVVQNLKTSVEHQGGSIHELQQEMDDIIYPMRENIVRLYQRAQVLDFDSLPNKQELAMTEASSFPLRQQSGIHRFWNAVSNFSVTGHVHDRNRSRSRGKSIDGGKTDDGTDRKDAGARDSKQDGDGDGDGDGNGNNESSGLASIMVVSNDMVAMQQTAGQVDVGEARLRYRLSEVRHGRFGGKPACLLVVDLNFNYDETCPVTRAQISITFGSRRTERAESSDDKAKNAENAENAPAIVPFATDLRWPRTAHGPSSNVHISRETTWQLKVGASGFSIETPATTRGRSGDQTDSGWRIAGGPDVVPRPFPWQRRYLWRVSGNAFNNYPVPADFSLGMVVLHDMVDFWAAVRVDGSLRGVRANSRRAASTAAASVRWNPIRQGLWRIKALDVADVNLDDALLESTMTAKYRKIFADLRFGGDDKSLADSPHKPTTDSDST